MKKLLKFYYVKNLLILRNIYVNKNLIKIKKYIKNKQNQILKIFNQKKKKIQNEKKSKKSSSNDAGNQKDQQKEQQQGLSQQGLSLRILGLDHIQQQKEKNNTYAYCHIILYYGHNILYQYCTATLPITKLHNVLWNETLTNTPLLSNLPLETRITFQIFTTKSSRSLLGSIKEKNNPKSLGKSSFGKSSQVLPWQVLPWSS